MNDNHKTAGGNRPDDEIDELLTLHEVAELLRVPDATLRYWRYLGTGPRSFRVGRGVRYWRGEVHSWLRSQSGTGPHAA
jgi:predicted DNA-binding transcriptional regulator AlpA